VSRWRAAGLSGRPSQQASGLELGKQQTLAKCLAGGLDGW